MESIVLLGRIRTACYSLQTFSWLGSLIAHFIRHQNEMCTKFLVSNQVFLPNSEPFQYCAVNRRIFVTVHFLVIQHLSSDFLFKS